MTKSSSSAQIVCGILARATILYEIVLHGLPFAKRAKAGALDSSDMHEYVVAAIVRGDEAETLGAVKNFTVPVFITISFQSLELPGVSGEIIDDEGKNDRRSRRRDKSRRQSSINSM